MNPLYLLTAAVTVLSNKIRIFLACFVKASAAHTTITVLQMVGGLRYLPNGLMPFVKNRITQHGLDITRAPNQSTAPEPWATLSSRTGLQELS